MRLWGAVLVLYLCSCGGGPDEPAPPVELSPLTGPRVGVAVLSIQHPDFSRPRPELNGATLCDLVIKAIAPAKRPILPFLFKFFGSDETCLHKVADAFSDREHTFRVYLSYERLPDTDPARGDLPPGDAALISRAAEARALISRIANPNTRVEWVLELEHKRPRADALRRAAIVEPILGAPVDLNPVRSGEDTGNHRSEAHGKRAHCDSKVRSVSQDGSVFSEEESAEWLNRNKTCDGIFLWWPEDQGLIRGGADYRKPAGDPGDRHMSFNRAAIYERLISSFEAH